jgi:hypothetical protein
MRRTSALSGFCDRRQAAERGLKLRFRPQWRAQVWTARAGAAPGAASHSFPLDNFLGRVGAASRIKEEMGRVSWSFAGVALIFAATQAAADPVAPAPPKPGLQHGAKSKTVKPAQPQSSSLAGIPFSNPYAPPVGAGKSTGAGGPAPPRAAPAEPKGNLSLTYKWKGNNEPVDPFWNIRSAPGSEAPGDSFMGGLKLGF